ncbi:hypothetical protein Y032_0003g1422 [Ancylostoma ceylanicum]|uniref:Uncharacterized protein n=1 Tax=Ancylostoma ceylanicum TaxID=53326 RepID=A0A016VZG4_9BILA|nr:hypothetical protein Y032_0003g1422 [Ancylostoma ceylanicum]
MLLLRVWPLIDRGRWQIARPRLSKSPRGCLTTQMIFDLLVEPFLAALTSRNEPHTAILCRYHEDADWRQRRNERAMRKD